MYVGNSSLGGDKVKVRDTDLSSVSNPNYKREMKDTKKITTNVGHRKAKLIKKLARKEENQER